MELSLLAEPFNSSDVEWRIGRSGMKDGKPWATALAYVTNRAIMNRLDSVCTPAEWRNEYKEWNVGQNHGVLCGISIRSHVNETGWEWVTKWDGAENTDIESVKGGLSDAMKRAAVQWGIGRYLYNLEEAFVDCSMTKQAGWNFAKGTDRASKQDFTFYWKTPSLPSWALPSVAMKKDPLKDAKEIEDKLNTPATEAQLTRLTELCKETGTDKAKFASSHGVVNGFVSEGNAKIMIAELEKELSDKLNNL